MLRTKPQSYASRSPYITPLSPSPSTKVGGTVMDDVNVLGVEILDSKSEPSSFSSTTTSSGGRCRSDARSALASGPVSAPHQSGTRGPSLPGRDRFAIPMEVSRLDGWDSSSSSSRSSGEGRGLSWRSKYFGVYATSVRVVAEGGSNVLPVVGFTSYDWRPVESCCCLSCPCWLSACEVRGRQ